MFKKLSFLGALFLVSCSKPPFGNPNVYLEHATIVGEIGMNGDTATALDVVLVYDPELLKQIVTLTANDYFLKKQQLMKDNPTLINAVGFEMVPGQVIPDAEITLSKLNAEGAIVFANYTTPGDHRFILGRQQNILIRLGAQDFTITPEG